MAPVLVTLNDLEGHSPIAGLFKCNPSNICAAFYQISTDSVLSRSLSDSWTSCCSYYRPLALRLLVYAEIDFFSCLQVLMMGSEKN